MLIVGRSLIFAGLGLFLLAIVVAMSSGLSRRGLFYSDFETTLPSLLLFFGGGLVAFVGSVLASKALDNAAPNAPAIPAKGNTNADPRLEAARALGVPVREGQSFDELVREVVLDPEKDRAHPAMTDPDPVRAKLEIMIPPKPSESWMGGRPSLPEGVAWPVTAEGPATFIAQIAVSDLPQGIWAGVGPKAGWIVMFAHSGGNAMKVLHVLEKGEEREPPQSFIPLGTELNTTDPRLLEELYGHQSGMIARWPLRIVPETRPPSDAERPDQCDENGKPVHKLWFSMEELGFDLTDRNWAPFDWPLTLALIMAVRVRLEQANDIPDVVRRRYANEGIDVEDVIARNKAMDRTMADLMGYVDGLASEHAFSEDFRDAVFQELSGLEWGSGPILRVLNRPEFFGAYVHYAASVYARDAKQLPTFIREKLEPFWARQAEVETGFMGGEIRDDFRAAGMSKSAVLLDIPSSHLVGWTFGDVSRLGAFIDLEDLQAGRLEAAGACTTHGYA